MATMLCRTKGNANPKGKPRVYFTCHPEDFDKYFLKICDDIFKTHSCAVFYTEDMSAVIAQQDRQTDLESNNLFVVPVTFKLLTTPNRAMDHDIPFAMEKRIPILPFMMEPGLDPIYSRPNKFGQLQYLNPYSTDATEVSYADKLKRYLESVLISDKMAQRVRAAFDAYIFLSYRKKDRRHANALMRLIHSHPECRDIAIWYDEFLTPGKNFRESIDTILSNSKLFTLLVTPNLLEEPEGKPNFVMAEEYPAARRSGIDILPAQMEQTDKALLSEKYQGLPPCIDPHDQAFKARLMESITKIATAENDNDPMHNFLIGVAYLEGIDVEVDRPRGLELITFAAEQDLPEAMEKLYCMYCDGTGVPLDYRKALVWIEKLANHYEATLGPEHSNTLSALNSLALTYSNLGHHQKALTLQEKAHELQCKVLGHTHPLTLNSLNTLVITYGHMHQYQKARELAQQAYDLRYQTLGSEHPDTISAMHNLAVAFMHLEQYTTALELTKQVYTLRCNILGKEHPDTLSSLGNLALIYKYLGQTQKALELDEQVYTLFCQTQGQKHPNTLIALGNLAMVYYGMEDYETALELLEKTYALWCEVMGQKHPFTLAILSSLAMTYGELGNRQKAMELGEKVVSQNCEVLGTEDPETLKSMNYLAVTHSLLDNHRRALELLQQVYPLRCKVLGQTHPDTLDSLFCMALAYIGLEQYQKALELTEQVYTLQCQVTGNDHPSALRIQKVLDALRMQLQ